MKTLNQILNDLPQPTLFQMNDGYTTDYLKDEKAIEYLIDLANEGNGTRSGNYIVNDAHTFIFDTLVRDNNWTLEAAMELSIELASYGILKQDVEQVKNKCVASLNDAYKAEDEYKETIPLDKARLTAEVFGLAEQEWTDIEIHPVAEMEDTKGIRFCEQCEAGQESFWSVYVRYKEGGLNCIADCDSEKTANTIKALIESLLKNHVARE